MSERGNIKLTSGRTIRLRRLDQHEVYSGLLEGLPTREMNQQIVERLVEKETDRRDVEPYVVVPKEKPIAVRDYPFGQPAAIPKIACVGEFDSFETASDPQKDYSSLVIIWFQDDYAFPIDPNVLEHIRALDWAKYAEDYEY